MIDAASTSTNDSSTVLSRIPTCPKRGTRKRNTSLANECVYPPPVGHLDVASGTS